MSDWQGKLRKSVRDHQRRYEAHVDQRMQAAAEAEDRAKEAAATLDAVIVPGIDLVADALEAEGVAVGHVRRQSELAQQTCPWEEVTIARPDGRLVSIWIMSQVRDGNVVFTVESPHALEAPAELSNPTPEMVASAIADAYINALNGPRLGA